MNLLSYQPGSQFSGKKILDWAWYQIINKTSHQKVAKYVIEHYGDLRPDADYSMYMGHQRTDKISNRVPHFMKVRDEDDNSN